MILTLVLHQADGPVSEDAMRDLVDATAPKYQTIRGLNRKYYISGPNGTAGGMYEWDDRESADAFFTDQWRADMAALYGKDPEVVFFESPAVVDNTVADVLMDI